MIDPSTVTILHAAGDGDMGSLTYGVYVADALDNNNKARFALPNGAAYTLAFARAHFVGGTGTAELAVNLDAIRGPSFDMQLATVSARGTGADLNFRVRTEEQSQWVFEPGDVIVLTWADPGTTAWAATVGLAEVVDNAAG